MWSTLKGKEFAPKGANSFPLIVDYLGDGGKIEMVGCFPKKCTRSF